MILSSHFVDDAKKAWSFLDLTLKTHLQNVVAAMKRKNLANNDISYYDVARKIVYKAVYKGFWLWPSASGRTQDLGHSFFPIRTSRPVNNIYLF